MAARKDLKEGGGVAGHGIPGYPTELVESKRLRLSKRQHVVSDVGHSGLQLR